MCAIVSCEGGETFTEVEGILFFVRVIVTLLGPLIMCFFLVSLVNTMKGGEMFCFALLFVFFPIKCFWLKELEGEQVKSKTAYVNFLGVVVLAIFIKVLFVGFRVFFIIWLVYVHVKPSRRTFRNRLISDVLEMSFCLDFLWSGLWLGVITGFFVC